jgi:lysophospholipase L1-like esterase
MFPEVSAVLNRKGCSTFIAVLDAREIPMTTRRDLLALASGAAVAAAVSPAGAASAHGRSARDVGTWAAPPTTIPPTGLLTLSDQTVRHVVHLSIGGDQLRVRLTNEFGDTPLRIGEVRVARRSIPGVSRQVTFGGHPSALIPAGAPLVSDPVDLRVPAADDLLVSIYLPSVTPVTTLFAFSYQDNVIAAGNVTAAPQVTATQTLQQVLFLSGVSVRSSASAIVTLGDSITNGANTTADLNHRWPDLLAARLRRAGLDRGVVNVGISGNRILHDPNPPAGNPAEAYAAYFGQSALRRFDRDVLTQPGASDVIVLLGINDLGHPGTSAPASEVVSADDLIAGHRQLIARSRQAGLRIFGGTILPFKDDTLDFWSAENERKRQAVNRWIRTGGEYDGVVDFDRAMQAPGDPLHLNPAYDSGDHLHPNDAGMVVMAAAVPLGFFR